MASFIIFVVEVRLVGFASEVSRLAREEEMPLALNNLLPVPTLVYPAPASRSLNSRLNGGRLKDVFGIPLSA